MSLDLDQIVMRIAWLERTVGVPSTSGLRTVMERLAAAERDICGLEAAKMQRESDLTWQTVKDMCVARDAGASMVLTGPQVKSIAGLIESEWGKQ